MKTRGRKKLTQAAIAATIRLERIETTVKWRTFGKLFGWQLAGHSGNVARFIVGCGAVADTIWISERAADDIEQALKRAAPQRKPTAQA